MTGEELFMLGIWSPPILAAIWGRKKKRITKKCCLVKNVSLLYQTTSSLFVARQTISRQLKLVRQRGCVVVLKNNAQIFLRIWVINEITENIKSGL